MQKSKSQSESRPKLLISPLFTFFFYSHSPSEYENLREKQRSELMNFFGYDGKFRDYYEDNKNRAEATILYILENKYPTPICWNDIAGFIAIRIENPIEGFRVVADVWSIKNRRFKTKRILDRGYSPFKIIAKELLVNPEKFNEEFFSKVEELLVEIDKKFLKKKRFHFSLENNRMGWTLIKTTNVAKFLKELGSNWRY